MAARLLALRVELRHQLDRVPHQAQAVRQCRLEMVTVRIRHIDAKEPVEARRFGEVVRDDPDCGELGHGRTLT